MNELAQQRGRIKDVAAMLGISVSSVRRVIKTTPDFPRGVALTPNVTIYSLPDVAKWLEDRFRAATPKSNQDAT